MTKDAYTISIVRLDELASVILAKAPPADRETVEIYFRMLMAAARRDSTFEGWTPPPLQTIPPKYHLPNDFDSNQPLQNEQLEQEAQLLATRLRQSRRLGHMYKTSDDAIRSARRMVATRELNKEHGRNDAGPLQ